MPSGLHNWSQTAASNNSADSAINWAEGQAPSSVNDSARGMMAVIAKWRDDNNGSLTTGGSSTAYTLTTNTGFTTLALMDNQTVAFTAHTDSGATPTLDVDSLGAKTIRNWTGATFPTGGLKSGSVYRATYDNSAGEWVLHNAAGVLQANQVTTAAITDAAVTLAKQANLAQNTIIGRYTASTGVPQALTLSTGLAVDSSTGNVTATINESLLTGFLSGLILSTAGSSSTFTVGVGAANDSSAGGIMLNGTSLSKTTSSWAVGSTNGGLDTGSIATNTWYHVYLIKRVDTGVVDALFSTSASSPTMPSNYTLKRRIGSIKTDGSNQWVKFSQVGDEFIWDTMVADSGTAGTSRSNLTLTVPTGVVVKAMGRAGTAAGGSNSVNFTSLLESDQAPSGSPPKSDLEQPSGGGIVVANIARWTDTSARIGMRASNAGVGVVFYTYGWVDLRGRN